MNLIKYELKKILKNPLVWIVLVIALIVNMISICCGNTYYSPINPEFKEHITLEKEIGAKYSGTINASWIEKINKNTNSILNDPKYKLDSKSAQRKVYDYIKDNDLAGHFSGDPVQYVMEHEPTLLLNSKGQKAYDECEVLFFASGFYKYSLLTGKNHSKAYREKYQGSKGRTLAAFTNKKYHSLATNYSAHYNYTEGWDRLDSSLNTYIVTIGLFILVALSGLFSSEYSLHTDSLILSSRKGKKQIINAKILTGIILAIGVWLLITIINIIFVSLFYGFTGWEAFWQDWSEKTLPIQISTGPMTLIIFLTSLLGSIYCAITIMFISSISRTPFISITISAFIVFLPLFFKNGLLFTKSLVFTPSYMLWGNPIWFSFNPVCIFDKAVDIQYLVFPVAIMIMTSFIILIKHFFKRHTVTN